MDCGTMGEIEMIRVRDISFESRLVRGRIYKKARVQERTVRLPVSQSLDREAKPERVGLHPLDAKPGWREVPPPVADVAARSRRTVLTRLLENGASLRVIEEVAKMDVSNRSLVRALT